MADPKDNKKQMSMDKEKVILSNTANYDFEYDSPSRLIANKGWEYLEKIANDAHVGNTIDIRSKGLLRYPWMITPYSWIVTGKHIQNHN